MTQIEVSFSAFLTNFVHFWPILTQYFDLYCTKIMSWAYFGTQGTPLAILHTPKSCLVALNGLKRAKNWLKLMFHFLHFSLFSSIFGQIWLNILTWIVLVIEIDKQNSTEWSEVEFCKEISLYVSTRPLKTLIVDYFGKN